MTPNRRPASFVLVLPLVLLFSLLAPTVAAQACTTVSGTIPAPSVASGYSARLVATGLTTPRGIVFDMVGNLLTVQRGVGVVALAVREGDGGCVEVMGSTTVVGDDTLNHGIALSPSGDTLYASSTDSVYSYSYTASNTSVADSTGNLLVTNMTTSDHTTRTLLLSQQVPGMLIVTRGSTSNVDPLAEDITTGHSQIKAFNLLNMTSAYNFDTSGMLLGWGLRNDVGIAEHPTAHGLWAVENSVDQLERMGVDIHATNPGEKLNYFGTLTDNTSPNQGSNFGYPQCYAAWDVSVIPDNAGLQVGTQFAIGVQNSTVNDTFCRDDRTAPRLVFESHMAPLDIKFNAAGSEAYVSFHGSWDRAPLEPSGYKVSAVPFAGGAPVAASTSNAGYVDVVANQDNNACPDACFRPVGLAFDRVGRLWFSSDATGEIYVVTKDGALDGSVQSASFSVSAASTVPVSAATATASASSHNLAAPEGPGRSLVGLGVAVAAVVCALCLM